MKATALAHPIQGLVKYHGLRDERRRLPYHDSISVCTAPSHSKTTVEFDIDLDEDTYVVDGEELEGKAYERLERVVDTVREHSDAAHTVYPVRLESENSFPSNIGLGSSSSGFAAAAVALADAADLDATLEDISAMARHGSASAARSVTGGFSQLRAGLNDQDCRSERIETPLQDELRTVIGIVPTKKDTDRAHGEVESSHMFESRKAHIHDAIVEMRNALREGNFDRAFETAERDSLSLAATTMTGDEGWLYWQPATLAVFQRVRELREQEDIPVYFSTDTGATVYVNTTADHADFVEEQIEDVGVQTAVWEPGGPARLLNESEHLF